MAARGPPSFDHQNRGLEGSTINHHQSTIAWAVYGTVSLGTWFYPCCCAIFQDGLRGHSVDVDCGRRMNAWCLCALARPHTEMLLSLLGLVQSRGLEGSGSPPAAWIAVARVIERRRSSSAGPCCRPLDLILWGLAPRGGAAPAVRGCHGAKQL